MKSDCRLEQRARALLLGAAAGFWLFALAATPGAAADSEPIRFRVTPAEDGTSVSVRADFQLQGRVPYLRDFDQLASVRWFVNGAAVKVTTERMMDDYTAFKGLPSSGSASVLYTLRCVTRPTPGYRKRLVGGPGLVLARGGLFLSLVGHEQDDVDVAWDLPPGWRLGLGREGRQAWTSTQRSLWLAARRPAISLMTVQGTTLRLVVLEGVERTAQARVEEAVKTSFEYAIRTYGVPDARDVGLAIFPTGSLRGGTALGSTIATEDDFLTAVHELLHLWSNVQTPAWFREGVHTYIAAKILRDLGLLKERQFELFLQACLEEHRAVAKREGGLKSLADSSRDYDLNKGGGDIYGLMPVFAYRIDREIEKWSGLPGGGDESPSRARGGPSGLEKVFAVVCRERDKRFDLRNLIRLETGYDAEDLFRTYFDVPVEDPEALLRD